jgi:hypothetical protein
VKLVIDFFKLCQEQEKMRSYIVNGIHDVQPSSNHSESVSLAPNNQIRQVDIGTHGRSCHYYPLALSKFLTGLR